MKKGFLPIKLQMRGAKRSVPQALPKRDTLVSSIEIRSETRSLVEYPEDPSKPAFEIKATKVSVQ